MKTERAIELLHRLQDEQFDGIHGDERREALEMAVKALLSQQIVNDSQGLVNDCISRKMAIEAIEEMQLPIMRSEWESDQFKFSALAEVREMISGIPSAQPQRKKGKWINHRKDDGHNIADCDQCGNAIQWFDGDKIPRYCCMCGADMRGESE